MDNGKRWGVSWIWTLQKGTIEIDLDRELILAPLDYCIPEARSQTHEAFFASKEAIMNYIKQCCQREQAGPELVDCIRRVFLSKRGCP